MMEEITVNTAQFHYEMIYPASMTKKAVLSKPKLSQSLKNFSNKGFKGFKHPGDVLFITITYIAKEPHLPQTGCQQLV